MARSSDRLQVPETKPAAGDTLLLPIDKDNDGQLATMSLERYRELPASATEVVDTFEPDGFETMVKNVLALEMYLWRKQNPNSDEMAEEKQEDAIRSHVLNNYQLERFGVGTAYDAYLASRLNHGVSEQMSFTPQWEAVMKKYNVSDQLAANLRDTTIAESNLIIMRLDERARSAVNRASLPKSGIIHLKGGNWALGDKSVLVQPELGKCVNGSILTVTDDDHTPQTKNPKAFPNVIATRPKPYTVIEIVDGLRIGKYELDKDNCTQERLAFKTVPGKFNAPLHTDISFSVVLNKDAGTQMPDTNTILQTAIPTWNNKWGTWRDSWGDFNTVLQKEYPSQYKSSQQQSWQTVEEYVLVAKPNNKNVYNPVQHSFENHNPYEQLQIDKPGLCVYKGAPYILQSERDYIKFMLSRVEEKQIVHVHERWGMGENKWGPVVEGMLKNGVKIPQPTLEAFLGTEGNLKKCIDIARGLSVSSEAGSLFDTKMQKPAPILLSQLAEYVIKTLDSGKKSFAPQDIRSLLSKLNIGDSPTKDIASRLEASVIQHSKNHLVTHSSETSSIMQQERPLVTQQEDAPKGPTWHH